MLDGYSPVVFRFSTRKEDIGIFLPLSSPRIDDASIIVHIVFEITESLIEDRDQCFVRYFENELR